MCSLKSFYDGFAVHQNNKNFKRLIKALHNMHFYAGQKAVFNKTLRPMLMMILSMIPETALIVLLHHYIRGFSGFRQTNER